MCSRTLRTTPPVRQNEVGDCSFDHLVGHLTQIIDGHDLTDSTKPRSPRSSAWWAAGSGDRVSKGGAEKRTAAEKRAYIRDCRPRGLSLAEGCRLMGLARSTFYDAPATQADDAAIVARIEAICEEFEAYGYRRVGAELRHQGIVVNSKKSVA